jgi:16S rRNA C967 or C1407 C5-methylase (RsmB/RsmF family)
MQQRFDKEEFNSFVESFENASLPSVRVNRAKNEERFSQYNKVPWCPAGYYLDRKPVFTLDPAFHAGAYYPQEASSMVLWHLLEIIDTEENGRSLKVLDLCGAPGGKSTLI